MNNEPDEWFYAEAGNAIGPISEADLLAYLQINGTNTFVWREGQDDWLRAIEIHDLVPPEKVTTPRVSATSQESIVSRQDSSEKSGAFAVSAWLKVILDFLSLPIMLLNSFGGVVAAIWLLFRGDWRLVLLGFLSTLISPSALGVVLLPSMLIGAAAITLMERGALAQLIGALSLFLSEAWLYAVMIAWSWFSFQIVIGHRDSGPLLPYLLWAYAIATGPWSYMVLREARNGGNTYLPIAAYALTLGVMGMMAVLLFSSNPSFAARALALGIPLYEAFLFQMVMVMSKFFAAKRRL